MPFLNYLRNSKKIKGLFISIFIVSLFSFAVPQRAHAYLGVADIVFDPADVIQNTTGAIMSVFEKVKEYVLDPLVWALTKRMIQRLTAQTVNWINSGFEGNPAYVTDPGQFFLNTADDTASLFLSGTALNQLCTPFKANVRLTLVKNYLAETGGDNGQSFSCTLDRVKDNYDEFTRDFSVGGWDGWFEVTQYNQNNPYGVYLEAKNQLDIQVGNQISRYQDQLEQGRGFLSWEGCKEGTKYTAEDVRLAQDPSINFTPEQRAAIQVGKCSPKNMETKTPGSVIETQLDHTLGSGVRQLELADSFDEIIGALITQLTQRIIGGLGDGLRGAQNTIPIPDPENPNGPVIELRGDNPMEVEVASGGGFSARFRSQFQDPGAYAIDVRGNNISRRIVRTGEVDMTVQGIYELTYNVKDSQGVSATPVVRTVIVGDAVPADPMPNVPVTCVPDANGVLTCNFGGGSNIIPTRVTSSWNPQQTTNGWWPHVSPDGRYVAYGNFGESWVTDLSTFQNQDLAHPPEWIQGVRCISGQWINGSTVLSVWCDYSEVLDENGNHIPFYQDYMTRYEWTFDPAQSKWVPHLTGDNPKLVAGSWWVADEGHWSSLLATRQLVKDNAVLTTTPPPGSFQNPNDPGSSSIIGGTLSMDGDMTVHSCTNTDEQICVWQSSTISHIYNVQTPNVFTATEDGYIIYGYTKTRGIDPQGRDSDLSVAPNMFEEPVTMFVVSGTPWVVTHVWSGSTSEEFLILRPFGDRAVIAIKAAVAHHQASVGISGGNFVIAYSNGSGNMTVVTVPIATQRTLIQ